MTLLHKTSSERTLDIQCVLLTPFFNFILDFCRFIITPNNYSCYVPGLSYCVSLLNLQELTTYNL